MSERLTNILGYLTLFAILGAIWVLFGEDPSKEQGARNEPTFSNVDQQINDVEEINILSEKGQVSLARTNDGWVVKSRDAYQADDEKVRAFLRGIAKSERREPKTSNQSRFDVLGLGTKAKTISLKAAGGATVLEFAMGKRKANATSGRSLTYIYQDTDTRSWLVSELAEAQVDSAWWLDHSLFRFDDARVSDVTVNGVWLTRKFGDQDFKLQGVKANEQALPNWQLHSPARAIADFTFTDAKKLGNPLAEPFAKAVLNTYDGMVVTVDIYQMDEGRWAKISAAYDDTLRLDQEGLKAAAEVQAEIASIMAATREWVFKLSEIDAGTLSSVRADFVSNKQ
ncbi:DUF4340 domain-containing protein [Kordiimonas sp. SCSIO 12603]|uniref:DUF4340 domain-containing protein n=1 Tax=Kordiimonas sp. SCSIO 12603 TaxID=2829596 RepID=UPI0021021F73|nr:DUF4340 domain-containing protein [Kordiimonas sp. SCSIO 12603]UTW59438.1 DUF4340 domain-containing protein [Kordiimonas sp. SCSIO 12603]